MQISGLSQLLDKIRVGFSFLHPSSFAGQKRRFLLAGVGNVLLTNALLQILLFTKVIDIGFATFFSQVFNGCLGFFVYGNLVFASSGVKKLRGFDRYWVLMTIIWIMNWFGISLLHRLGINKGLAGLTMIFPLACLSYCLQKTWVFRPQ